MDQNFHVFIEIDGHKYDIIITEDVSSVCFENIFQKIQQIIKLALNEDIVFETHIFEIIDYNSSKGLVVQEFSHFVKHLSTIRIYRKPLISSPLYVNPPINPYLESNSVPNTVPKTPEDDFIPHEYYCDVCSQSMEKIDPRLKKHKLNLNFESYKRFSDLLLVIKEVSDSNCDTISDYRWFNVIPYKMRAFGHKDFSPKLWKNSFEIFLKKYIEVMDVSPNRFIACGLFPFFHEYHSFQFDPKECIDYQKIMGLREKMRRMGKSFSQMQEMSKKERKAFNKMLNRIADEEEDIKVFHFIVQLIDRNSVYRKKGRKKWTQVSDLLADNGYSSRIYSPNQCREKFYTWTSFYAQNYNKLNGNLEQNLQQIFDLFKIVHILDFTKIWSYNNSTHSLLRKISHKKEIKQYLDELNDRLLMLKPIHRRRKSHSGTDSITDKDLTPVAMDLEDGEIAEENTGCAKQVKGCNSKVESQSSASKQKPTTVPPIDPQQSPINGGKSHSNVILLSTEKTGFNTNTLHENTSLQKNFTIDLGDSEDSNEITNNDKPVVPLNKFVNTFVPLVPKSVVRKPVVLKSVVHKPVVPTPVVPKVVIEQKPPPPVIQTDPRLRNRNITSNNHSIVIPVSAEKSTPSTDAILPTNTQINANAIKTIPIKIINHSTQPSGSLDSRLRDPRLKRKLEQQIAESGKQWNVDSCAHNPCKKFKLEPI